MLARALAASLVAIGGWRSFAAPAGAKTKTKTYSSGPINVPIDDAALNFHARQAKGGR